MISNNNLLSFDDIIEYETEKYKSKTSEKARIVLLKNTILKYNLTSELNLDLNLIDNNKCKKYQIISNLGSGTYSNVFSSIIINNNDANDITDKINKKYAIKIYKNDINYKKYGIEELNLLLKFNKDSNNIVKLLDYFKINEHICLVFKEYDITLYKYYKTELNYSTIRLKNYLKVIRNICYGLIYLNKNEIINADKTRKYINRVE